MKLQQKIGIYYIQQNNFPLQAKSEMTLLSALLIMEYFAATKYRRIHHLQLYGIFVKSKRYLKQSAPTTPTEPR